MTTTESVAAHTELNPRTFASFSFVVLLLGLVTVGFGAVDLAMIAPKGLDAVAAVGEGDLLVSAVYAFFVGTVDVFSSRLAVAEGESSTSRRLPVLAAALLLLLIPGQLLAIVGGLLTEPALSALGQDDRLVPLIGDYVTVRVYSIVPVILYYVVNEALKICGLKNLSVINLVCGLAANALLNWAFLYTGLAPHFHSPEQAVAVSTVLAQIGMAGFGAVVFLARMRAAHRRFERPNRAAVTVEFSSMARTAPGVGARQLNDYAGSVVPLLFIASMGSQVLAPAVVATKIYTIFCRVPQACFATAFVYYGYASGRSRQAANAAVRRLLIYSALPTAIATAGVLILLPFLVAIFAGAGLDRGLAEVLLVAYLTYLAAYFFEQFFGELLTIHQRGALLFTASTVTTYGATIPLAWFSVSVLHSAFIAIASKGLSTLVLAVIFWAAFRRCGGTVER